MADTSSMGLLGQALKPGGWQNFAATRLSNTFPRFLVNIHCETWRHPEAAEQNPADHAGVVCCCHSQLDSRCDISRFFDTLSREWLIRFVEHRIGDRRIIRLIQKWLKAGVLEDGRLIETTEGTPQGSVASPLLANVYLHYVYDLWVEQWRTRHARGALPGRFYLPGQQCRAAVVCHPPWVCICDAMALLDTLLSGPLRADQ